MKPFSGHRAFLLQRLSAVVLLACLAAAAVRVAFGPAVTFAQWQAWSAHPLGAAALLLPAMAVLAHAWVGIRDVILDYIHPVRLRLAVLAAVAAGLVLLALWTTVIVVAHVISA
jgi:succinate dehydrogenase / fumarate reductase, membrane anchor subunit